jgi:hypothetical protein
MKINPKKSKRKLNDVDISSGQSFNKSREDLFQFAKDLGDCSISEKDDHSFDLTVRSFNECSLSNDFMKQFQLLNDKDFTKNAEEVLFCRQGHEERFLFRGKLVGTINTKMLKSKNVKVKKSKLKTKKKTSELCRICMAANSTCTFYPCGHVCLCDGCKQNYEKHFSMCPLCKANYTVCLRI